MADFKQIFKKMCNKSGFSCSLYRYRKTGNPGRPRLSQISALQGVYAGGVFTVSIRKTVLSSRLSLSQVRRAAKSSPSARIQTLGPQDPVPMPFAPSELAK